MLAFYRQCGVEYIFMFLGCNMHVVTLSELFLLTNKHFFDRLRGRLYARHPLLDGVFC